MREIGAEVKVKDINKIGRQNGKEKEMWLVKLGSEKQKREIMIRKKLLKGRKKTILDDLTWKERKIKWELNQIARKKEGSGRRVWISYGKLRIEGEW